MSYSGLHETSNIRPGTVKAGARRPQGGAALQGNLRDAPIPDTARQRPRPLAAQDRREPRVRLPDGAQRHPRAETDQQCEERDDDERRRYPAWDAEALKLVHAAFDGEGAEALRGLLHRSPREFGYQTSLWTLAMASEAAFEEGLTEERVSGETVRATLSRLLGVRWMRAKRWITSPDPLYERKKG